MLQVVTLSPRVRATPVFTEEAVLVFGAAAQDLCAGGLDGPACGMLRAFVLTLQRQLH